MFASVQTFQIAATEAPSRTIQARVPPPLENSLSLPAISSAIRPSAAVEDRPPAVAQRRQGQLVLAAEHEHGPGDRRQEAHRDRGQHRVGGVAAGGRERDPRGEQHHDRGVSQGRACHDGSEPRTRPEQMPAPNSRRCRRRRRRSPPPPAGSAARRRGCSRPPPSAPPRAASRRRRPSTPPLIAWVEEIGKPRKVADQDRRRAGALGGEALGGVHLDDPRPPRPACSRRPPP